MKYRVIRDCHYVARYWDEGEIAEFADGVTPPDHFEKLQGGVPPKAEVVHVPGTMHEMNVQRSETAPKTGMAHKPASADWLPESVDDPAPVWSEKGKKTKAQK